MEKQNYLQTQLQQSQPIDRMGRVRNVHMIGIGGAGMSGVAEVLLSLGYRVQGSDQAASTVTRRLQALGTKVWFEHSAEHIAQADVVVVSNAIAGDNPEWQAALRNRIPVISRAEMLAELMRFRFGVAVAGTHGKTTTTSLVASILAEANYDPTFVVGGQVRSFNSHARLGAGRFLVAEADESDGSFLRLSPMMSVITNIDNDHLENHDGNVQNLRASFVEFVHRLPFYGVVVLCGDDPGVMSVLPQLSRPSITYGTTARVDVKITQIYARPGGSSFTLEYADKTFKDLWINLPGRHNVFNATAAVVIANELNVQEDAIRQALAKFQGVERRFQWLGDVHTATGKITLIDDYAHHPTEIAATLEAAQQEFPQRRHVVVFQPHRYSRTAALIDDFAHVLAGVPVLILTEVYAAGEAEHSGADGRALARAVRARAQVDPIFIPHLDDLAGTLQNVVREGDVVLLLGAGSIGRIARELSGNLGLQVIADRKSA